MTTAPSVELRFNPTDLRPMDLPHAGAYMGSPADALEAAMAVARAQMADRLRNEIQGIAEPSQAQLLRIADLAWQATFWNFRKVSAPIIADAYIRAYRRADAGDVPMSVVYDLADKHVEKIGDYFHTSSRSALAEGFASQVNRRVPAKAAAGKVLDAYGLTPRQMRAYNSASQFTNPVNSMVPQSLRARARAYVDRAFTQRTRKMARQEEHNIDQQAQQFAWMWLQDKGRLSKKAQKMWITASDERVCEICGPLHRRKVNLNSQFKTAHGDFWTPGLHPNCRCVVRLIENRFSKGVFAKAEWEPKEHPRGGDPKNRGRFSRLPETKTASKPVIATQSIFESLRERTVEDDGKLGWPGRATGDEEEGKLSWGSGEKLSMGGQLGWSSGLSMGGQLSMTPEKDEEDKLSMKESKGLTMTPEEVKEKLAWLTTPSMQMEMDRTFQAMEWATEEYAKPKRRSLKRYLRATIPIRDNEGNEYPVYTVVNPGELNWHGGQVELNHTKLWTPSLDRARGWADEAFAKQVSDKVDRVMGNDDHIFGMTDDEDVRWQVVLDESDVLEVVGWMAYQGRTADPDSATNDYETLLYWENRDGEVLEKRYKVSKLAKMMNIKPSDFDVRILTMDEGHDSQDGQTAMDQARTKHGYEEWVTSGRYDATKIQPKEVGHNLSLKMFYIKPDAREIPAVGILD